MLVLLVHRRGLQGGAGGGGFLLVDDVDGSAGQVGEQLAVGG